MPISVTTTVEKTRFALAAARDANLTIGLVPTMGALHEGHASLIRRARRDNGFVAVSVFVNPTQFGPNEDFHRYPRPFERDLEICKRENVDLVFHPSPESMYPGGFQTVVDVQSLTRPLCGASRPGHFRGVTTVVLKLFNITQPHRAYFGQKDAQQLRVIERMARDLDVPIEIVACPIVREADGLALSSRNQYLTPSQRLHAVALVQCLEAIRHRVKQGERNVATLRAAAMAHLQATPEARIDYCEILSWEELTPVTEVHGKTLVAMAVFFGATRLIDNMVLDEGASG